MIFIFEQALRSTVTNVNFVERYGGVVRPVSQQREGETPNGNATTYTDTFPVSRYVSVSDCFDGGMYRSLIPDESYKSVVYWEQRGNANISQGGPKGLQWRVDQSMRLVCWLNFQKIGLTNYDDTDKLELYMLQQIHSQHGQIKTTGGYKFRLGVSRFRPVERSERVVFGPYSYSGKEWAFSWPYGFFAIDFEFTAELAAGCITAPTLGSEITCIETW